MDDKTHNEYIEYRKKMNGGDSDIEIPHDLKKTKINGGGSKSKSSGGVLYVGEDETNE